MTVTSGLKSFFSIADVFFLKNEKKGKNASYSQRSCYVTKEE